MKKHGNWIDVKFAPARRVLASRRDHEKIDHPLELIAHVEGRLW